MESHRKLTAGHRRFHSVDPVATLLADSCLELGRVRMACANASPELVYLHEFRRIRGIGHVLADASVRSRYAITCDNSRPIHGAGDRRSLRGYKKLAKISAIAEYRRRDSTLKPANVRSRAFAFLKADS